MTELRSIHTNGIPVVDRDCQDEAPRLEWVAVDLLCLDDTYQRPLLSKNWTHIKKIAAKFSWHRFSALVVSEREDGRYAIIDGQHRTHAAVLCGIKKVPCLIHKMEVAEEAASFSSINGDVQAMSGFHVYRAAFAAGEEWAVNAERVVREAGCKLMTFNKSAQQKLPGEIFCIKVISNMIESGEGEVVTKGLKALKASQPGEDPVIYGAQYLKPFLMAVASNAQFLRLDLVRFLNEVDVEEIVELAAVRARSSPHSKGSLAMADLTAALRKFRAEAAA